MNEEPEVIELPPTVQALGDPRRGDATWTLMPVDTSDGQCSQCGRAHEPDEPHDGNSMFYQYAFHAEHGRFPTWADALAHLDDEMYEAWRDGLAGHGVVVPPREASP